MTSTGLRLEWSQQTELMGRQISLGLKAVGTSEHAGVTELVRLEPVDVMTSPSARHLPPPRSHHRRRHRHHHCRRLPTTIIPHYSHQPLLHRVAEARQLTARPRHRRL